MTAGPPEAPPPDRRHPLHHKVRNSLLDTERHFRLEPDALTWEEGEKSTTVRYDEIRSVQLIGYAGAGGRHLQARLGLANGDVVKIRSHHYRGIGNFEDRSASYAAFMSELCRRLAGASGNTRFIAGSTTLWILWLVVALLAVTLAVLAIAVIYLPSAPVLPAILVLVIAGPLIWREARKGPAETFDPLDPPLNGS